MTERLYYDQSDLTEFDAVVLSCEPLDGAFDVVLDRTAFYPTSGGQPFDAGALGGVDVLDVNVDPAGVVHHACAGPLAAGDRVRGRIDWPRRFDHMQQHTADHIIAGYIHRLYGGYTVGLHLGRDFSTIDVVMPDGATHLSDQQVDELESLANADIQRDLPVRCSFPTEAEMANLPLRKDPTVDQHIRVVLIGDEECVACGGTHVSTAGQIGLVKILWTAPSRGKLRLAFVAGERALRDYRERFRAVEAAGALLSCQPAELPGAVQAVQDRCRALELELGRMKRDAALALADRLADEAAELPDGWLLACASLPELDMDALKEIAKRLIARERMCVLLCRDTQLLFARSPGEGQDMGKLMKELTSKRGGRGGGRPDFAQGAADGPDALTEAREMTEALHGK